MSGVEVDVDVGVVGLDCLVAVGPTGVFVGDGESAGVAGVSTGTTFTTEVTIASASAADVEAAGIAAGVVAVVDSVTVRMVLLQKRAVDETNTEVGVDGSAEAEVKDVVASTAELEAAEEVGTGAAVDVVTGAAADVGAGAAPPV